MNWGLHLTLDCRGCDREAISSENCIRAWLSDLVGRIKMVAVGTPVVVPLGMRAEHLAGYTCVQLIETSHVTGHFVDATGDAYIDVFSCAEFSQAAVEDCVRSHFRPAAITALLRERQAV